MVTLSKAKLESKTVLRWMGIFFLAIILLIIFIKPLSQLKKAVFPAKSSKPQVAFGKIPQVAFPNIENKNFSYSLDTITGFLPALNSQAKVYQITPSKPAFLALEKTQERISRVGFTGKGNLLSDNTFQWVDQKSPTRVMTINIFSQDFNLKTSFLTSEEIHTLVSSNEERKAIDVASEFLQTLSLFPKDIDNNKTKTALFVTKDGNLIKATSISSANIVRVDFFQKDIDRLPIFYENGLASTINFLVKRDQDKLDIANAHYSYKNISDSFSTYPLKSVGQGFLELKEGKAYIPVKPQNTKNISIKEVLLGYYVGEKEQNFLMPIFIFKNGDEFIAYVSAVRDEWISN